MTKKQGDDIKKVPVHAPGVRKGETGKELRGKLPPVGKHWQYTPDELDDSSQGIPRQDIWLNYRESINQAQTTTGYPTEKIWIC